LLVVSIADYPVRDKPVHVPVDLQTLADPLIWGSDWAGVGKSSIINALKLQMAATNRSEERAKALAAANEAQFVSSSGSLDVGKVKIRPAPLHLPLSYYLILGIALLQTGLYIFSQAVKDGEDACLVYISSWQGTGAVLIVFAGCHSR